MIQVVETERGLGGYQPRRPQKACDSRKKFPFSDGGSTPPTSTNLPIVRPASACRMRSPENLPGRSQVKVSLRMLDTQAKCWGSPQGEPAVLCEIVQSKDTAASLWQCRGGNRLSHQCAIIQARARFVDSPGNVGIESHSRTHLPQGRLANALGNEGNAPRLHAAA